MEDVVNLYVTIGISKSGKTTWSKKMVNEYSDIVHVSSDEIREELTGGVYDKTRNNEVFSIMYKRTLKHLKEGKNVIYDATNLGFKKRRHFLKTIIKDMNNAGKQFWIRYKMFFCDIETLMDRAEKDDFPKDVIMRQLRSFQVPGELLDVNHIRKKIDSLEFTGSSQNIENLQIKMIGFDQNNEHHKLDLYDHCKKVETNITVTYLKPFGMWHDVGKLYTRIEGEDGQSHYPNHANVSAYLYFAYISLHSRYLMDSFRDMGAFIQEHMNIKFINTKKAYDSLLERMGISQESHNNPLLYLSLMDDMSRK